MDEQKLNERLFKLSNKIGGICDKYIGLPVNNGNITALKVELQNLLRAENLYNYLEVIVERDDDDPRKTNVRWEMK